MKFLLLAFDPCSSDPCKNGGSCQMVEPEIEGEKPTFECYCPPGRGASEDQNGIMIFQASEVQPVINDRAIQIR